MTQAQIDGVRQAWDRIDAERDRARNATPTPPVSLIALDLKPPLPAHNTFRLMPHLPAVNGGLC